MALSVSHGLVCALGCEAGDAAADAAAIALVEAHNEKAATPAEILRKKADIFTAPRPTQTPILTEIAHPAAFSGNIPLNDNVVAALQQLHLRNDLFQEMWHPGHSSVRKLAIIH